MNKIEIIKRIKKHIRKPIQMLHIEELCTPTSLSTFRNYRIRSSWAQEQAEAIYEELFGNR